MQIGWHTGYPARQNLSAFRNEFAKQIRVLVIDRLESDINPAPGHRSIRAPKIGPSFSVLGFHELLNFAMQGVPAKKRIILLFLQSSRSIWALFIPGADIPGNRFSLRPGFSALQNDDIARHRLVLCFRGRFFFFAFSAFFIGETEQRGDGLTNPSRFPLFLDLCLALDREARKRDRFKPGMRDCFS